MDSASFFIYCTVATFTPGPTNIVLLSTVHHRGARAAMRYAYGATAGFGVLLGLSALVNTILAAVIPAILMGMRLIGSGYMLYLAYRLYTMNVAVQADAPRNATFGSGFLMQFLNPKVVLFALTVIPTFLAPNDAATPAVAAGVLMITGIGFAAFVAWVLFGAIFRSLLQQHTKRVNILLAGALAYAAMMIWT
ncbi:LysE family translocator [Paenibacillus methanolicus]|uniref:Threonine/homoserine/homoserine lactone efflux protein n=1 Tax=Paenibacillus methanolicus TaxID=582686 RepID=A0A5S5C5J8_9BACL|nr:LysE family transporter [Paenibacillus methanolicus]TYP74607.1 threonine/homoserine/homoserine lactone efflux protein [Paenibacillus methanolicus]